MSEAPNLVAHFTVFGEPASKANGRELKWNFKAKRNFLVKSDKALTYAGLVAAQVPRRDPLLTGDLAATITVYYASRRPDLDVTVLLDALQGRVYENDRQVREQHLYHEVDRDNPRAVVMIAPRGHG